MEPILPHSIPPATSAARDSAEQGEKAGTPDTACSGENRFGSILKRTASGQENFAKGRPSAHGGRRAAVAGKKAKGDDSAPPSASAVVWGSIASNPPDDSRPGAGVTAAEPNGAASEKGGPAPVPAGAATLPAAEDPLLKLLASGIQPAAADGEKNSAPAQAPKAGGPVPVSAPPPATASGPNDAGSEKGGPVPVPAGTATLPAAEDPLLKLLASGIQPAAADGEKNSAPAQAPKAGGPVPVSAPPPATASEPNGAGSAKGGPVPVLAGAATLPAEGDPRSAEGTRKRKDDVSARNDGHAEPVTTPPADGIRGVAERPVPPRPVDPASDPGVVRFDEKAFVITRKSGTSVEVTLAPPGVGKLALEVVLEKGVVNARITAADSAGREAIARCLPQIVEALARDGMNIGGFTVSLKERRDGTEDAPAHGASRDPDTRLLSAVTPPAPTSAASAGLVDIFV